MTPELSKNVDHFKSLINPEIINYLVAVMQPLFQ